MILKVEDERGVPINSAWRRVFVLENTALS